MIVNRQAVNAYLDRELDSWLWMKGLRRATIEQELKRFRVPPVFKTKPWLHQLVCMYIGMCEPRFLYLLKMGMGKALESSQKVQTPFGPVPIGSLKPGDSVLGSDGLPTLVTGVFPQGRKRVFSVTMSDGNNVVCCDEHLWKIKTPGGQWTVAPLKAFKDDLRNAPSNGRSSGNRKWFTPIAQPFDFGLEPDLPLSPYLVGVLAGDGSLTGSNCAITFHESDQELMDRVESLLPPGVYSVLSNTQGSVLSRSFKGNGGFLRRAIRQLGLNCGSREKSIPTKYLYAGPADRAELLAGLLDTDGWAIKSGAFGFSVVSETLAENVQFLAQSLGGVAKLSASRNDFGPVFSVFGRTPHNPFRLSRKAEVYSLGKLKPTRSFQSVIECGEADCTCISVAAGDGLFVLETGIVTHNTKVLADLMTQAQREKMMTRALVTVPHVINMGSWQDDLLLHSDLEPNACTVSDIEEKWERLVDPRGDVTIINYAGLALAVSKKVRGKGKSNNLVPDEKKLERLTKIYDFIGLDETHYLGNQSSLWFRVLDRLTKHAPRTYGATGTLFGKKPEVLWPQFKLVDRGETFGEHLGLFRAAFFTADSNGFGTEFNYIKSRSSDLHRLLCHRSIRYDYDDVDDIDLPLLVNRVVHVDFVEEQRQHYLKALQGLINAQGGGDTDLEAPWIRMRQIIAGFLAWNDQHGPHIVRFKENPKLLAMEGLLSDLDFEDKLVICHEYNETGRMITERLTELKIKHEWLWGGTKDKAGTRTRFMEDPSCRVFVMNSKAGGTGNDGLQKVCRYMLFYESPTSPTVRGQTIGRLHRPGQKERVFVYDLVMKRSTDKGILDDIALGKDLYEAIVSGLRLRAEIAR